MVREGSFANRIREAARGLAGGGAPIEAAELAHWAGLQTYAEKRRMYHAIKDMVKRGEMEPAGVGRYRWVARRRPLPEIREAMWRVLRARRKVSVEDLMELCGASREYAREWLRMLERRGVVKEEAKGAFRLISDPVAMPKDDAKAERLRALRAARKAEALAALDKAEKALVKAREAVSGL